MSATREKAFMWPVTTRTILEAHRASSASDMRGREVYEAAPGADDFSFPVSAEQPAMRASDCAENRHNRRQQQDDVRARNTPENSPRIARRFGLEPPMSGRLDDENESHEQTPHQNHGVEPPERRVAELGPEI